MYLQVINSLDTGTPTENFFREHKKIIRIKIM